MDANVDQLELALYDREGIIVDELIGTVTIPHHRISPSNSLMELWVPVQPIGKASLLSSSVLTSSQTPEICVTIKFIDSDTRLTIEAAQKTKSDIRQRKKEMKRLFNLDEEYLHDFSCNLDHGAVPGFGRVYITSTKVLYNSTFKQKCINLEDIKSIEKYKTMLLTNTGITLFLKNGKKVQLKNFKHRKTFIAAIQLEVKNLGLPPIPTEDRSSADEGPIEQDSSDEVDMSRSPSDPTQASTATPVFIPVLSTSPPPLSDPSISASPPQNLAPFSDSMKRSSSAKLRDSGTHFDGIEKREKDTHKRTPSTVAAIVRSVSDKLRNISSSSSNVTHHKSPETSQTTAATLMSSDGSSGSIPARDSPFAAALAPASPHTAVSSSNASNPPSKPTQGAQSSAQPATKPKEKTSIFPSMLKDLSLPFHLPGSKRKQSVSSTPSVEQQGDSEAAEESSSSDTDQSDMEREQSRRLKYYLIHGEEAPAGSGEEESDHEVRKRRKKPSPSSGPVRSLKQAHAAIQRSAASNDEDSSHETPLSGKGNPKENSVSSLRLVRSNSSTDPSDPRIIVSDEATPSSSHDDIFLSPRTDLSSAATSPRTGSQFSHSSSIQAIPLHFDAPPHIQTPQTHLPYLHPLLAPNAVSLRQSAPPPVAKPMDDSDRSEDVEAPRGTKRSAGTTLPFSSSHLPATAPQYVRGHGRLASTSNTIGPTHSAGSKRDSIASNHSRSAATLSTTSLKRSYDKSDFLARAAKEEDAEDEETSDSIAGSGDHSQSSPVRQRRVSHSVVPPVRQSTASVGQGERYESKTSGSTPRASLAGSTSSLAKTGGKKDALTQSSSLKLARAEVTSSGSSTKSRTRKASSASLSHSSAHITSSSTPLSASSSSQGPKMSASASIPKKRVKSTECATCTTPTFVQRLPALILQTCLFSFVLAATILLRASNPNSVLYPSYYLATPAHRHKGTTHGPTNGTPSAAPATKGKSSGLYSPQELLGLAAMACFASVVAQCASFIFAHLDQRKTHWRTHFATASSPFLREHLIPFLCLISGHILMLIVGHTLTAIASVFNSPCNKLYLVSPNTYVLYVVFCSIGCHLIAKRQAAADQ